MQSGPTHRGGYHWKNASVNVGKTVSFQCTVDGQKLYRLYSHLKLHDPPSKIPQNNCWPNFLSMNSTSTTMESKWQNFDVLVYVPLTNRNLSQRNSNTMYFHLRVQSAQLAIQPKQDVCSYFNLNNSQVLGKKHRKFIWRWHRFYCIFMSNITKRFLKNRVKKSTQRFHRHPPMTWLCP